MIIFMNFRYFKLKELLYFMLKENQILKIISIVYIYFDNNIYCVVDLQVYLMDLEMFLKDSESEF